MPPQPPHKPDADPFLNDDGPTRMQSPAALAASELKNEDGPTMMDGAADLRAIISHVEAQEAAAEEMGQPVAKTMILDPALYGGGGPGGPGMAPPPSAPRPVAAPVVRTAPMGAPRAAAAPAPMASASPLTPGPAALAPADDGSFGKRLVLAFVLTFLGGVLLLGVAFMVWRLLVG